MIAALAAVCGLGCALLAWACVLVGARAERDHGR